MGRLRPSSRSVALTSALAAALAASLVAPSARAGEDEELQSAIGRIEGAQYAEAAQRFERLLDPRERPCAAGPELTPSGCRLTNIELIKRAREQYVVALYAMGKVDVVEGRVDDVRSQLEAILEADPTFQANPTLFPQKLMNLFVEIRGRRAEKIAAAAREAAEKAQRERATADATRKAELAYIASLEAQAAQQQHTEERSRLYAMVPFGVGQFQNRDLGLGFFFGGTQLVAGGTSIIAAVVLWEQEQAFRATDVDLVEAQRQLDTLDAVNKVAFSLFAVSLVAGIVEAQLSFEDAVVRVDKRPLPKRPPTLSRVSPTVVPMPGGAGLGATGAF